MLRVQSNNLDDVRLAALSGHGRAKGRADASRPTAISLLKGQGVAGACVLPALSFLG